LLISVVSVNLEIMKLNEAEEKFILHWGEMGGRWGINRAVAQVHALLLVAPEPIDAQEVSETLNLARSNVSVALRELGSWKLIRRTGVLGERRDYFEADRDPWSMLARIAQKRIEHEILPTIDCLKELKSDGNCSATQKEFFHDLQELFAGSVSFFEKVRGLPRGVIRRLLKFDRKIESLFYGKSS